MKEKGELEEGRKEGRQNIGTVSCHYQYLNPLFVTKARSGSPSSFSRGSSPLAKRGQLGEPQHRSEGLGADSEAGSRVGDTAPPRSGESAEAREWT